MAMYRFNLPFREAHCPQSYPQRNPQPCPLHPKGAWKTTDGRDTSDGKAAGPQNRYVGHPGDMRNRKAGGAPAENSNDLTARRGW